ncbi:profilin, required for normal timing of actin polymerization in response to thermal stress, partial [Dispira parvispora]
SAGFEPKDDEIIKIAQAFNDASGIRANGLWVAGVKYFALRCDDEVLLGKKQEMGVVCIKTKQAIVIGVHDSSLQAGEANVKLNTVANSLKATGY